MIQDQNQQHVEVSDAKNKGGEGKQSMSTLTWVLIGIGAAAAIGLLIWLIVASTKKTENNVIEGQEVAEEEVLPWTKIDGKIKFLGSNSSSNTINGKTVSKQVYEVEDNRGRRQIPKEQYERLDKKRDLPSVPAQVDDLPSAPVQADLPSAPVQADVPSAPVQLPEGQKPWYYRWPAKVKELICTYPKTFCGLTALLCLSQFATLNPAHTERYCKHDGDNNLVGCVNIGCDTVSGSPTKVGHSAPTVRHDGEFSHVAWEHQQSVPNKPNSHAKCEYTARFPKGADLQQRINTLMQDQTSEVWFGTPDLDLD